MAYEQKNNSGSLFRNDKKQTEKQPDYNGTVKVDGKDYKLAAWIKESKSGQKYFSLSLQEANVVPSDNTSSATAFGAKSGTDLPF
mgnify:CR=1 FL=1